MWLSDSGSGFGKIVKRQTDLQKKCQKGLHNDIEKSEKEFIQMEAIIQSMTKEEREEYSKSWLYIHECLHKKKN